MKCTFDTIRYNFTTILRNQKYHFKSINTISDVKKPITTIKQGQNSL